MNFPGNMKFSECIFLIGSISIVMMILLIDQDDFVDEKGLYSCTNEVEVLSDCREEAISFKYALFRDVTIDAISAILF